MPLYALGIGITIFAAVRAVQRGEGSSWLWIILFFPPIGGIVYLINQYFDTTGFGRRAFRVRKVTAADLHLAEAEVRRLDNAASWTEYASLLRARKDHKRAAEAAQRAMERDPESLDARYELGLALLAAGHHAQAVEALQWVVGRDPGYDSDDALHALARARMEVQDIRGARANLEELSQRRARPEILYDLADTQAAMGDRDQALRSLQRIIDEAKLVPDYLQRGVEPWVRRARASKKKLGG